MAEFMGVDLTEEEHALVLEKSSFDYMKRIGTKFDPIGLGPPWANSAGAMMRKGKVGNSSEHLTKADRDGIDKHWRMALLSLGSDFAYDEYYALEPEAD